MARRPRYECPDGTYHLTTRGVDRNSIVRDDTDRRSWLALLAEVVLRFRWRCHAFCLMGTHYHVVATARRADFSDGFHRLNGLHAQRFNRRHDRTGHLFGDRFVAWTIESDEHLAAACLYVLDNPVRAGLCARAEDWPWSGLEPRLRELDEHTFGR